MSTSLGEGEVTVGSVESGEITDDGNATATTDFGSLYTYKSNLGEGGFGLVNKYQHNITGQFVAVKTANNPISRIDQQHEVAALKSLSPHPNITTLIEYRPEEDRIIMQYYSGPNLDDRIENFRRMNEQFPEAFVFHVFNELVLALLHIHGSGVLHRDIKPANVVLDTETQDPNSLYPRIVLVDYGLAKIGSASHADACGTPMWGAPSHEAPIHSEASDIYSVGAIIHGLCTHRAPKAEVPRGENINEWYRNTPQDISRIVQGEGAAVALTYEAADHFTFEQNRRIPKVGYSHILEYWMNRALHNDPGKRATLHELATDMKVDADAQIAYWRSYVDQVCIPQGYRRICQISFKRPDSDWRPDPNWDPADS